MFLFLYFVEFQTSNYWSHVARCCKAHTTKSTCRAYAENNFKKMCGGDFEQAKMSIEGLSFSSK